MVDRLIYLNGHMLPEGAAHLSALDRGFTLGDGVFETLRAVGVRLFRIDDHLARLQRSVATVGLVVPEGGPMLSEAISSLLAANQLEDALVRITVSRGVPAERGLLPPSSPSPTLVIHATPFVGYPRERYQRGFTAAVAAIRRNESSPLSYIKSCSYLDSVLARIEAGRRGADEALLLNTAGWLACGSSSNLFLVSREALITPSLDCGVLEGVTRREVLRRATAEGLEVLEQRLAPRDMFLAEEAFVTNTALGVMPLVAIDGRRVGRGRPGPITLRLKAAYDELLLATK